MEVLVIKKHFEESTEYLVVSMYESPKYYNVKELVYSDSLANNIYLNSKEYMEVPYLTIDEGDIDSCIDISSLFVIYKKKGTDLSDTLLTKISDVYRKACNIPDDNNFLDVKGIREILKCFKELESYLDGDVPHINIKPIWYNSENFRLTKQKVDKLNSSGKTKNLVISGENKTIRRINPEDELFIEVPSYQELVFSDPDFPDARIICPAVIDCIERQSISEDEKKRLIRLANSSRYKEVPQDIVPRSYITGSSTANDIDIMDCEKRYKEALNNLMLQGISSECPDVPIEDCIKSNRGSILVRDYLIRLGLYAAAINWSHCGLYPTNLLNILSSSDDDDDDSEDGEESSRTSSDDGYMTSKYEYDAEFMRSLPFSRFGDTELTEIMKQEFNTNMFSLIDFVIKLLRFGDKKPRRVKLASNSGKWFDLNTLRITNNSGNFNGEVKTFDDGSILEPTALIRLQTFITDKNYLNKNNIRESSIDIPIGIKTVKRFKDSEETQNIFISFFDLNENMKVKGFHFDKNYISIDEDIQNILNNNNITVNQVVKEVMNSTDLSSVVEVSDEFKEQYFKYNAFNNSISCFSICNNLIQEKDLGILDLFSFNSEEDLKVNIQTFTQPASAFISANYLKSILPIICNVNDWYMKSTLEGNDKSLNETLNKLVYLINITGAVTGSDILNNTAVKSSDIFNKEDDGEVQISKFFSKDMGDRVPCAVVVSPEQFEKLKAKMPNISDLGTFTIKSKSSPTGKETVKMIGKMGDSPSNQPRLFLNPNTDMGAIKKILRLPKLAKVITSSLSSALENKEVEYVYEDIETLHYYSKVIDTLIEVSL